MHRISQIISKQVMVKIAGEDEDTGDGVPGYKMIKSNPMEGVGMDALSGGLQGGVAGLFAGGFHPGVSRTLGPLGAAGVGGVLGAAAGGGMSALLNKLLSARSEQLKKKLLQTGDITPESEAKAEETWQRLYGKK